MYLKCLSYKKTRTYTMLKFMLIRAFAITTVVEGVNDMLYNRQNFRGDQYPMARQGFGPPQMSNQRFGSPRNNAFSQRQDYAPYPMDPRQGQQQFTPYQQEAAPRNASFSDNLNTMMGHVGTITNGLNAMRQVGSMFNLFR
jgi:hypothetical protein